MLWLLERNVSMRRGFLSTHNIMFWLRNKKLIFDYRERRLLCLSELAMIVLHKNTRKLTNNLKQAEKSISNYQICKNL